MSAKSYEEKELCLHAAIQDPHMMSTNVYDQQPVNTERSLVDRQLDGFVFYK